MKKIFLVLLSLGAVLSAVAQAPPADSLAMTPADSLVLPTLDTIGWKTTIIKKRVEGEKVKVTITETTPDTMVEIQTSPTERVETVPVTTIEPVWQPGLDERFVRVDCTQYTTSTTETRRTALDRMIVVEGGYIYGHKIEAEVLRMKFPLTSFFYLKDTGGEILDVSATELDEGQRVYSMAFTPRDAKRFPFYKAIEPVSSMLYSIGKFAGGTPGTKDGKVVITPENAPDDLRTMAEEYFNDMQKGWIAAVPGRMPTDRRNDIARALVQQNYLRFIGAELDGLYSDGDLETMRPVTLLPGYAVECEGKQIGAVRTGNEDIFTLFEYARLHPEKETVSPFAGDDTARTWSFEFPFCDKELEMFGFILTPFTMRFDVRTFYDSRSDATYFFYFYSMGYEPERFSDSNNSDPAKIKVEWKWSEFAEDMRKSAGFEPGNYRLETMDVMVCDIFATFEKITVTEEEFAAAAIRATEYITLTDIVSRSSDTYAVDCSWLAREAVPTWKLAYIPVTRFVDATVTTPGETVREIIPGRKITIDFYIQLPDKYVPIGWFRRPIVREGEKVPPPPPPKPNPPVEPVSVPPTPPVPEPEPEPDIVPVHIPGYTVSPVKSAVVSGIDIFDIAEDATHTYIAGYAGGYSRIVAIEKQSGGTSEIYRSTGSMMDGSRGEVKRLMADGQGGVLVQFSNHPAMLLRDGKLSATKLPKRADLEDYPHLKAVMPGGNVVLTIPGGNPRNILVDPVTGEIKATVAGDKMAANEPKIGTIAVAGGTIWQPAGGVFAKSYSLISGLGSGAEPVVTSLDTSVGSPFKGRVVEIKAAPDGGVVLISGFGLHRTADGGKTWSTVDSKTLFQYGGFERIAVNSRSEVWTVINTTKEGYTAVRYNPTLERLLFRTSEFGDSGGGTPVKLQNAPKLLFVDSADNLWMVSGTYGSPGVMLFNPAGIAGYTSIATNKETAIR